VGGNKQQQHTSSQAQHIIYLGVPQSCLE